MKKFILFISLISIIFFIHIGIKSYEKTNIIKEKKFGNILAYLQIINNTNNQNTDFFLNKFSIILNTFNVTPKQFKLSLKYYLKNSNKFSDIFKFMFDEIELQKAILGELE